MYPGPPSVRDLIFPLKVIAIIMAMVSWSLGSGYNYKLISNLHPSPQGGEGRGRRHRCRLLADDASRRRRSHPSSWVVIYTHNENGLDDDLVMPVVTFVVALCRRSDRPTLRVTPYVLVFGLLAVSAAKSKTLYWCRDQDLHLVNLGRPMILIESPGDSLVTPRVTIQKSEIL